MDNELLWWSYTYKVIKDGKVMQFTQTYDCVTEEYSEEWHPVEEVKQQTTQLK